MMFFFLQKNASGFPVHVTQLDSPFPGSLALSGLPIHVARIPAAPFPLAPFSVIHDLPSSLVLSLPLKNRYRRGFSVYPAASQPAVFALAGYPVHLADSRSARFSLGVCVCSWCVPAPNTLRATSPRSSVDGLPTTSAVLKPHAKSSPVFTPM